VFQCCGQRPVNEIAAELATKLKLGLETRPPEEQIAGAWLADRRALQWGPASFSHLYLTISWAAPKPPTGFFVPEGQADSQARSAWNEENLWASLHRIQALRAWLWSLDVSNPWPEVAKIA
jgi:hypothetical protein